MENDDLWCRVCGWAPAAEAKFTTVATLYRRTRLTSRAGPFCRDCGIAVFRDLTARALPGWWYPFAFFMMPLLVGGNLLQRRTVARLEPPSRQRTVITPAERTIAKLQGRQLRPRDTPLPTGQPLYRRKEIVGVLAPVLFVAFIVFVTATTTS
jgi:hypothetical protein